MLKKILKEVKFIRDVSFTVNFLLLNKYIPNVNKPKTYNEKINYRKKNFKNPLFSLCSDKVAVKDYVEKKVSKDIVIPNLFIGESVSLEVVKKLLLEHESFLLKANHNSGPVYSLSSEMSDNILRDACDDINRQLSIDFGKYQNEHWYSNIKPKVLIEKRIYPEKGERDLKDYKFHVFKRADGSLKILLHVDFDRSNNHNRSFFDEDLNWLPFSTYVPSIHTKMIRPKNYDVMLDIVKKLSEPFSYVRVDLYNVDGYIYFGELTFAPGSGLSPFTSKGYDLWMGNLWENDPSY